MRRRIVVLGATGRTGGLIARELTGEDGVLLLGRSPGALAALSAETGHQTEAVDLQSIASVLVPGDVLVSCVGPFDLIGDQVVESAIRAGVTYLDVTGEPAFLWRMFTRHHKPAQAAGVTLLPALGYEYLPGLLLAEHALAPVLQDAHTVQIAYLADGGLQAGSASGRRSLVRALLRPTTTYSDRMLKTEQVAARRSSFKAGDRKYSTISLGGLEVWVLPTRHPHLHAVDVHTGWFAQMGPAVQLATRLAKPARLLAIDRLMDQLLSLTADGPSDGLSTGRSRFVARVRAADGQVISRREAVGGNPIVLAARLAAAAARSVADHRVDELPGGVSDPISALGLQEVERLAEWAGLAEISG